MKIQIKSVFVFVLLACMVSDIVAEAVTVDGGIAVKVAKTAHVSHVVPPVHEAIVVRPAIVEGHKKEIAKLARRNKLFGYVVTGVAVGAVVGGSYVLARALYQALCSRGVDQILLAELEIPVYGHRSSSGFAEKLQLAQNIEQMKEIAKELYRDVARLKAAQRSNDEHKSSGFGALVKSWAFQGVHVIGFSALSMTAQSYLSNKISFVEDINWFVSKKTHVAHAFEQLQQYAHNFDNRRHLPPYLVAHTMGTFPDQLKDVVAECERVLGFLEYLLERSEDKALFVPRDLRELPGVMVGMINDFCAQMQEAIQVYRKGGEPRSMADETKKFVTDLQNSMSSYAFFDDRIQSNR